MKTSAYGPLTMAFLAFGLTASSVPARSRTPNPRESNSNVKRVAGYRSWTRVNPKPIVMQPQAAAMCGSFSPASKGPSPHLEKFSVIYVNAVGKNAMLRKKNPRFPVGTFIVKEKLARADSKSAELITAMVRHAKGYNPENGDWEYMVLNGKGTKVTEQGKLEACQDCHSQPPAVDNVYRAYYLPSNLASALK